jgi:hypothetical protein
LKEVLMSETVKATIVGTIIIGIFMLASVKMVTGTVWEMARRTKAYVEVNKEEARQIVKQEKRKAKEIYLEAAKEK